MNDELREAIKLYIQNAKLLDGNKELDEESRKLYLDRYQSVFGESSLLDISSKEALEEKLEEIKLKLEERFSKERDVVYQELSNIFNEDHNKPRTSQTYNAISYEPNSVVREILQNVFDRSYENGLKLSVQMNPARREISFSYNEKGFDWDSLIFYFNAGDSAKGETQTGKFGLGIKAVMYNVNRLSVDAKGPDKKKIHWEVKRIEQRENKDEVKKSLKLLELKSTEEVVEETTVTISVDHQLYEDIESNFTNIIPKGKTSGSGMYIDLPELTFAYVKTCGGIADTFMQMWINGRELRWKNENGHITIKDSESEAVLKFLYRDCNNTMYLDAMLFLETEEYQFDNSGLYATYRLCEDCSFGEAGGGIFTSVKKEFVESHRKSLKSADTVRKAICEEAEEQALALFWDNENNRKLLCVTLKKNEQNRLTAVYSKYLQWLMTFMKSMQRRQKVARMVTAPEQLEDGTAITYLYHSAVAKCRFSYYADTNKNASLYYGIKGTSIAIGSHAALKELMTREVQSKREGCLVVLDMFLADYKEVEDFVDCSNVSCDANYEMAPSFIRYMKEITAIQMTEGFPTYCIYGYNGSLAKLGVHKLVDVELKRYYASEKSIFSVLCRITGEKDSQDRISDCRKTLEEIVGRHAAMSKADIPVYEQCEVSGLKEVFKEDYEKIKRECESEELKQDGSIGFQEILEKYWYLWEEDNTIVIGKYAIVQRVQTLEDMVRQNDKFRRSLEMLQEANKSVPEFEQRVKEVLRGTCLFPKEQAKCMVKYVVDDIGKVAPYNVASNGKVLLVFPPGKYEPMGMKAFKTYLDERLNRLGIKKFSDLEKIKTNIVYSDQLPMIQKIVYPLKKGEYKKICQELRRREGNKGSRNEKYKEVLLKDITPAYYGNGYCCCVKHCGFCVSSSFAYNALEFKFNSFNSWAIVCRNHEELLKNSNNENISIIGISFGDKSMEAFTEYVKGLNDNDRIPGKYRKVKIHYLERYRAEIFDPNRENNESEEEVSQTTELELSPTTFAYWLEALAVF